MHTTLSKSVTFDIDNDKRRNKIANLPLITTLYQNQLHTSNYSQSFRINNPNYVFNDSELFNSDIDNSDEFISLDVDGENTTENTKLDIQLDTMSPFVDVSKYSKQQRKQQQQQQKTFLQDTLSIVTTMSSSSSSNGYSTFDFMNKLTNSQLFLDNLHTDDEGDEEEDEFIYINNVNHHHHRKKQKQQQQQQQQRYEKSTSPLRNYKNRLNNASTRTKSTVLIESSDEDQDLSSMLNDDYNYYEKLRLELLENQENPLKFKRNTFATINTTDFFDDQKLFTSKLKHSKSNDEYENVMFVPMSYSKNVVAKKFNKKKSYTINEYLDENLLVEIFSYLSTIDKLNISFVCKKWYHIIWSKHYQYKLWNRINIDYSSSSSSASPDPSSTPSTPSTTFALAYPAFTCKQAPIKQKPNADRILKFLLNTNKTYPLCICVEYITIRGNHRFTDKGLELIATRCPELKYLSLRNCSNIKTNSIMKLILNCTNLKYIDLTGCFNITNLIYQGIDGIQSAAVSSISILNYPKQQHQLIYFYLQYVDLSDCTNINDLCIKNVCKYCVYLKNLYLRRCKLLTDTSLLYISKYCRNLKELSLCQCVKITDTGMKYLSGEFIGAKKPKVYHSSSSTPIHRYKIKYLSLAKCPLVTDKSLIYLTNIGFFNQIKYLNLRGCSMVSDKFIKYFTGSNSRTLNELSMNKKSALSRLPIQLKSLDIGKCSITDKSLEYICRLGHLVPNKVIQRLSLRNLDFISDTGICLLAANFKHLQHLNVAKCPKITSKSLQEIKKNCKSCIIQHTSLTFC